jgi:uncharacterized protein (UPF0276 family)
MQLAVNYSLPLIRLLQENKIKVDLIKCPNWEGMVKDAQKFGPVTIHYDLKTGLGQTFKINFEKIKSLKEQTQTPHINTHLVTPRNFDVASAQEQQQINALWRKEVQLMTDFFSPELVALEHFPYTKTTPHLQYATDSQVFSSVIQDSGCMLLLDLAHASITANTLGINTKDYISSLPVDKLVEMHVTGIQSYNGVLTDHFGLGNQDWALCDWAMDQIRIGKWRTPEIVAFEYGGVGEVFVWRTDTEIIQTQVPKLYETIHS